MKLKVWTKKQIRQHEKAAQKLCLIKQEFYSHILGNMRITEKECLEFIRNAYKKHELVNDHKKEFAIVAFGEHTKEVHYFPAPKSKPYPLTPNSLVLLDIWARLDETNAPYADVTFMFYFGKDIPKEILVSWKILSGARNKAISFIKKYLKNGQLPRGLDIDRAAHDVIGEASRGHGIKHTIGHSLGLNSPHGKLPGINWREYSRLKKNIGYTIEPGIYLENFGMRTEIDFYINTDNKVIITTELQDKIEVIK